jgi:hypothetical protein
MNSWIVNNEVTIKRVLRALVEAEYRPEYQSLPIRTMESLLKGAEAEIKRLQCELDNK